MRLALPSALFASLVTACSLDAGGLARTDAGGADGGGLDAGTDGVVPACTSDVDCDDGRYCNGAERCEGGARCVPGAGDPCPVGASCSEADDTCLTECDTGADADGDGHDSLACGGDDCDDTRPGVHPGAVEVCDDRDEDCDGAIDDDLRGTFWPDADGDGYGNASGGTVTACVAPEGTVPNDDDCDDASRAVRPGAPEVCDASGTDEDCDGIANPASLCSCTGSETRACALPGVCAAGTERCADGAWSACSIAGVAEVCNAIDDDCDGAIDEALTVACYVDGDNDGFAEGGAARVDACPDASRPEVGGCPARRTDRAPVGASNIDCDDASGARRPGATETCDLADEDCDGLIDEGLRVACFPDSDDDGYAGSGAMMASVCPVAGRTAVGGCPTGSTNLGPGGGADCDDGDPAIRPGATEVCLDGTSVDEDCDGAIDEMLAVTCYRDGDDDGYAATGTMSAPRCRDPSRSTVGYCPTLYTDRSPAAAADADCVDTNATIHPGGTEVCDAAMNDEDCDGTPNPAALCTCTDGAVQGCPLPGVCAAGTQMCAAGRWSACTIVGGPETCDGEDDDCDGSTDEGTTVGCFVDADNDTYAPTGAAMSADCAVAGRETVGGCPVGKTNRIPSGMTADCDDTTSAVSPAGTEVCIGGTSVDDDCDGMIDEGVAVICYPDDDDDTYASSSATARSECRDPSRAAVGYCPLLFTNRAPAGAPAIDCDDTNSTVHPMGVEICDPGMLDEDCDGITNPGCACTGTMTRPCPLPGVCSLGTQTCMSGAWGTCTVSPGSETCDGEDDDCDGNIDEGTTVSCYTDGDGDSYAPAGSAMALCSCGPGTTSRAPTAGNVDCDDGAAAVRPGASETCDRIDSNCSSGGGAALDEDNDGDMHAPIGATCTGGFARDDCNDTVALAFPGQTMWIATPYCAAGRTYCAAADTCLVTGTTCTGSSSGTTPSYDYDCDGSAERQPNTSCAATCGASCAQSGPRYSGGDDCGDTVDLRTCSCLGICMGTDTTDGTTLGCH